MEIESADLKSVTMIPSQSAKETKSQTLCVMVWHFVVARKEKSESEKNHQISYAHANFLTYHTPIIKKGLSPSKDQMQLDFLAP